MTVAELIEALKELPQQDTVYSYDRLNGAYTEIEKEYIMTTRAGVYL